MSRRRYLSTDISLDPRVNQLATKAGDFAALFYTWLIPHADDDCSLSGDPETLLYTVLPGRRDKTVGDIAKTLDAICQAGLLIREDHHLIFPPDTFYRYQSYIPAEKRRKLHRSAKNAEKRRRSAKNHVSPSPSPSLKEDTLSGKPDCDSSSLLVEKTIRRLNELACTSFRPDSKATVMHINGRLSEGYTLEDFEAVLESKWQEWSDNPGMRKFYRPQTLFAAKHFESYLQAANLNGHGNGHAPVIEELEGNMVKVDGVTMDRKTYELRHGRAN